MCESAQWHFRGLLFPLRYTFAGAMLPPFGADDQLLLVAVTVSPFFWLRGANKFWYVMVYLLGCVLAHLSQIGVVWSEPLLKLVITSFLLWAKNQLRPAPPRIAGRARLGPGILRLRQEKEDLLDTVWLATSNSQVRQLWQKVGELLGDELTRLQREALSIPPTPDASTA